MTEEQKTAEAARLRRIIRARTGVKGYESSLKDAKAALEALEATPAEPAEGEP